MNARLVDSPVLQSPVEWRFSYELFFLFEIDVGAIHVKPPRGTYIQEVRPGVAIMGLGCQFAPAGNLGGTLPAFTEVNWVILLEPDLSRRMPVPRMAVMTGRVTSEVPAFLDHTERVDKLPVYRSRDLRAEGNPEAAQVSVSDEHGPIFSMWSTFPGTHTFQTRTQWVQIRSDLDGQWFQAVRWTGPLFEHQQGHRAAVLHQHPFFDGVDVRGVGDRCYLQMVAPPGADVRLDFHAPVQVGR